MKKLLFFLLIGGGLFAVTSCTKNYTQVTPNETLFANIKTTDWGTSNANLTDTVFIKVSQIDNYINNQGDVLVNLTFDNGTTYEPIPYVYNNVNYSYIYGKGGIILYAQSADGTKAITTPPACTAKIVLVPSN